MMEYLADHQLNIMLGLSSACGTIVLFVLIARALPAKRRMALLLLEISSMMLLYCDRLAYIYSGDSSEAGYIGVRVTNFFVFTLTNMVVLSLNLYLIDVLKKEAGVKVIPKRLIACSILSLVGIGMVIISQFTNLYYYFDELNHYHRGPGFIVCYLFPVVTPLIQLTVILQNRKKINRGIYISLVLFIVVPILAAIVQIFAYGLSLVNIAIVGMAVLLYIFALLDINNKLERANEREIEYFKEQRKSMLRLFNQTASAFINAIDSKDPYTSGHSVRVANYAKMIAMSCGKSERECNEIYYTALLHDVGKIGIPDIILAKEERTPEEQEIFKNKTIIGNEILSNITEYPYLGDGAHYVHERFDGKGYPEGLKGQEIPEHARIVTVADYYDVLTSKKKDRDYYPQFIVREEMIKGSRTRFDPRFVAAMVALIDRDPEYKLRENNENDEIDFNVETEIRCEEYRSKVSQGILIEENPKVIGFDCKCDNDSPTGFAAPSIILFDSYDSRIHKDPKNVDAFGYTEYGEIWFDGHFNSTNARNMEVHVTDIGGNQSTTADSHYEIETFRFEDHLKLVITGEGRKLDLVVALPNSSKYAYVGLTGEYCQLYNINIEAKEQIAGDGKDNMENAINRIAPIVSYTNRLESDLPNIQIDRNRSANSEAMLVEDGLNVVFHSMSLPSANLVWHCPYVVLFSSDNGQVNGPNYKEYALVKLNGETEAEDEYADNSMVKNLADDFVDWETWKERNKEGIDCHISFRQKRKYIEMAVEDGGILVRNTTRFKVKPKDVYFALTGDECAITDIRVSK